MNCILYSAKNIAVNILPRFVHVRSCPELLFEGGVDGNKGRCCTLVASAQQALSRQDVDTPVRALATGVSTVTDMGREKHPKDLDKVFTCLYPMLNLGFWRKEIK